nr:hypothetical protein [Flavisolibacter sp.]
VKDPEVRVYHDRTQERNFKTKVGNYPHQLVLGASVPLHIRAIGLQNAAITYTEKSDITGLEGEVKVRDLQLYFTNLTNKPALIQKDPVMKAEGKGNILGSPITALFNFHLDSSNGQFNVKGQVGNMKGAQLNVISVPLAQIQINSLQIHKVDFAITADDNNGYCNLDMTYNDFSITIKEISRDEGTRESRGFISKAVNRFIVYNHNPLNGNTRVARGAKFMRLNDQSFFGMVWRSIFAGMQEIMLSSGSL